jgi:large subunit ribosomal protein L10
MALNLEDKKTLVAEVAEVAATAHSVVAAEYRGLTVSQMTELRTKARKSGVYMRVVKNTLARKALAGTSFESVGPKLKGPLVLAFSKDDPGAAARVVKDFAKANDKLVATLVSIGGQVLPATALEQVASLPTREQALSMLLGALKAPMQKLASLLNEPPAKLARTLAAYRDQKGGTAASAYLTCLELIFGDPTWLSAKTKSSMQFPN